MAGSPEQVDWAHLAWVCGGTMGAAACANSLNQASSSVVTKGFGDKCILAVASGSVGDPGHLSRLLQWYEVANDALMKRTCRRPLPMGVISRNHALAFAAAVGAGSIGLLYWKVRHSCMFAAASCLAFLAIKHGTFITTPT